MINAPPAEVVVAGSDRAWLDAVNASSARQQGASCRAERLGGQCSIALPAAPIGCRSPGASHDRSLPCIRTMPSLPYVSNRGGRTASMTPTTYCQDLATSIASRPLVRSPSKSCANWERTSSSIWRRALSQLTSWASCFLMSRRSRSPIKEFAMRPLSRHKKLHSDLIWNVEPLTQRGKAGVQFHHGRPTDRPLPGERRRRVHLRYPLRGEHRCRGCHARFPHPLHPRPSRRLVQSMISCAKGRSS